MSEATDLNSIALTIIQAVGLLLPVVLLSLSFVDRDFTPEEEWIIEKIEKPLVLMVYTMLSTLTFSGLLATIGILETGIRSVLIFLSILSLSIFFLSYGLFFFLVLYYPRRLRRKYSYK